MRSRREDEDEGGVCLLHSVDGASCLLTKRALLPGRGYSVQYLTNLGLGLGLSAHSLLSDQSATFAPFESKATPRREDGSNSEGKTSVDGLTPLIIDDTVMCGADRLLQRQHDLRVHGSIPQEKTLGFPQNTKAISSRYQQH